MIIVTSSEITGRSITKTLGMVRGSTVRARHLGNDILATLRILVGGEVGEYTKMLAEAREQAIDRMIHDARELKADAIVDVRFTSAEIARGAAEILVYGTAVTLSPAAE